MILPASFYTRKEVVLVARELLGKVICTRIDHQLTSGIITETEAYAGVDDRASHAFGGRRTERTEVMYRQGGTAYVYLCYGIHSLFNVVTSVGNDPHAILIRAITPLEGQDVMKERKGRAVRDKDGVGPGNVSVLLGIHYRDSGRSLVAVSDQTRQIWIEDRGIVFPDDRVITGPRVGVEYAGPDALLPYRFMVQQGGAVIEKK